MAYGTLSIFPMEFPYFPFQDFPDSLKLFLSLSLSDNQKCTTKKAAEKGETYYWEECLKMDIHWGQKDLTVELIDGDSKKILGTALVNLEDPLDRGKGDTPCFFKSDDNRDMGKLWLSLAVKCNY